MSTQMLVGGFLLLVMLGVGYLVLRTSRWIYDRLVMIHDVVHRTAQTGPPELKVDLSGTETRLSKQLKGLPDIVVNSITGSANIQKGKLGELIGYMSMKAEYDRIVPLGTIVDFMAIKFPTEEEEGCVHFIDIKTGKHSRLTPDQRRLKALLDKKALSFKTLRVDEIEIN